MRRDTRQGTGMTPPYLRSHRSEGSVRLPWMEPDPTIALHRVMARAARAVFSARAEASDFKYRKQALRYSNRGER